MIADIFLQVAITSLFASVLILGLLLASPLLKRRYRTNWCCVIWLVIAIRLLVPVNLSLPQPLVSVELPQLLVSVELPQQFIEYPVGVTMAIPIASTVETPLVNPGYFTDLSGVNNLVNGISNNVYSNAYSGTVHKVSPVQNISPLTSVEQAPSFLDMAGFVWLAGVLILLVFQMGSYLYFLWSLKNSSKGIIPHFVEEIVERAGNDIGIRKLPKIIITNVIDSPVLIGIIKPTVLLPHLNFTNIELEFILRHEFTHMRRKDLLRRIILLLTNALHWFNPVVYLMNRQMVKDIEMACDDEVICEFDMDTRSMYGHTILAATKRRFTPMYSTNFGSQKRNLKNRLANLFDTTAKRRGIGLVCVVAFAVIFISSWLTFSRAGHDIYDNFESSSYYTDMIQSSEMLLFGNDRVIDIFQSNHEPLNVGDIIYIDDAFIEFMVEMELRRNKVNDITGIWLLEEFGLLNVGDIIYVDDTFIDFMAEMELRRNKVKGIAGVWVIEEFGLSPEEMGFVFEANIHFLDYVQGWGWHSGQQEIWRVNIADINGVAITSVLVNPNNGEVNEIIVVAPTRSYIEVDGMNIILVDYTWSTDIWGRGPMVGVDRDEFYMNPGFAERYIPVEEIGALIARSVYEEFGICLDGSRFDMFSAFDSYSFPLRWGISIFFDSERIITIGTPLDEVPDLSSHLDLITGEIRHFMPER